MGRRSVARAVKAAVLLEAAYRCGSPRCRHTLTLELHHIVWVRDGGRCTFLGHDGTRFPERNRLEYHHDDPYGLGGDLSASNIRLLCKCHNLYMAELDFGKEEIDAYRRSSDRVREPVPSFLSSPRKELSRARFLR